MSVYYGSRCNSGWSLLLRLEEILTSRGSNDKLTCREEMTSLAYEIVSDVAARIRGIGVGSKTSRR